MKSYARHLSRIQKLKRKQYHPLLHKIHKKHKISRKTLFYVKEYGPHTNIPKTIIKESIKILLLASIISSLGGLSLEYIKILFISVIPFVVLLPALNGMIGDFGAILSSRFSTMLHEGRVKGNWWKNRELKKLFFQLMLIALFISALSSVIAIIVSSFAGYGISAVIAAKIFAIVVLDVLFLVSIVFISTVFAGMYFFRKKEDPNNFLIPISTSIADFGNMLILTLLIILMF